MPQRHASQAHIQRRGYSAKPRRSEEGPKELGAVAAQDDDPVTPLNAETRQQGRHLARLREQVRCRVIGPVSESNGHFVAAQLGGLFQ